MSKVLITGGAGFIGSNYIHHALKIHPDWEIWNFDKLTYAGNPANLRDIEDDRRYHFIKGDIAQPQAVTQAMKNNFDLVINFAAETHVDRSIQRGQEFLQTNIIGTHTLLEAVRGSTVSTLLHISTDEVYGDLPAGRFATEADILHPSSPYSASKAGADLLALSHARTYNLPLLITRCTNNYGPFQYPEKMLPLFVTNLLEGKKIPVYGDGRQIRDWLHVDDHCRAIDIVLARGRRGEMYNLGANHQPELSNLDVTRIILNELDQPETMIEHVTDRAGHDRRYAVDTSKIQELGWQAEVPVDQGLRATIRWYRDHPDWWQPIKSGEFREYYERQYRPAR